MICFPLLFFFRYFFIMSFKKKFLIKRVSYIFAFGSEKKAAAEEAAYLASREKKNDFQPEIYEKKRKLFGVILFESDQDLDPTVAYVSYED